MDCNDGGIVASNQIDIKRLPYISYIATLRQDNEVIQHSTTSAVLFLSKITPSAKFTIIT